MHNLITLLDGGFGTMLQKQGIKLGHNPGLLCLEQPEAVTAIHRQYVEAGSRIIYANTFSANRLKLEGTGHSVEEVVTVAIGCAKDACRGTNAKVALDIGPIGQLMRPMGSLSFDRCYEIFKEMCVAGENAGADLVAIETMMDLAEARCAVLAAKENTSLPVLVTMTYEDSGRSFLGCDVAAMGMVLEGVGADAVGINCSLGPDRMLPVVQRLAQYTSLPLVVKLNAGLPDPQTGEYSLSPDEYAALLEPYLELPVAFVGGCCGTTPDYIRAVKARFGMRTVKQNSFTSKSRVCSSRKVVELDNIRVIGERINPTGKKRFQQALREGDLDYILAQGVAQADAGADILDVNVGIPQVDEPALMAQVVEGLQGALDLPLQIDSSDPAALERGLRQYCGKAIVNSVNGKQQVLDSILPIVKQYGAAVIGLCMDENGIPQTAQGRFDIAARILKAAQAHGIPNEDVYIDCLTLTVSAQQEQAAETLEAVQRVKQELGLKTTLGVSNISFGLPNRELLNSGFLTMAMARGLDLPILNPNNKAMMDAVRTARVLLGQDAGCAAYVETYANQESAPAPKAGQVRSLQELVEKGLRQEARAAAKALLESAQPLDIIQQQLIPALDRVGEQFEQGRLFLPQLMNAAETAQCAFEVLQEAIAKTGQQKLSGGKIVVATVEGDIHDIGKNIAKCILENYGYTVLDLGRDVPAEKVAEAAAREDVKLVGLSALMTTTLPSMAKTIALLQEKCPGCKVFGAGAVLTPEYAAEMGADYYAKDAKQAVDIAKEVLGN
ncbi:MAG: homocysteine S-methyltransferase family protein [Clostridia bacterium]|nr:homocysteine S-methyltransferase family protein [Clostridia bacterium]